MFWIKDIFLKNPFLSFILLFSSVFLLGSYYKKKTIFYLFFLLAFFILIFFQFKTTNFQEGYKFLPVEIDLQIKRMNQFPPELARLGYFLEYKKEILIFNKYSNNFFDILDFKLYFGNYFSFFSIPFFFVGLFYFFSSLRKLLKVIFISAVILLSILGKNGLFGPFLFFPYFVLFIIIGLLKFVKVFKK